MSGRREKKRRSEEEKEGKRKRKSTVFKQILIESLKRSNLLLPSCRKVFLLKFWNLRIEKSISLVQNEVYEFRNDNVFLVQSIVFVKLRRHGTPGIHFTIASFRQTFRCRDPLSSRLLFHSLSPFILSKSIFYFSLFYH